MEPGREGAARTAHAGNKTSVRLRLEIVVTQEIHEALIIGLRQS
jgi:hypothetical protein